MVILLPVLVVVLVNGLVVVLWALVLLWYCAVLGSFLGFLVLGSARYRLLGVVKVRIWWV